MERRLVDRRGKIFVHYRSFNRADVGISEFRRALARGALTYWEHRGRSKEGRSSDRPGQRASIYQDGPEAGLSAHHPIHRSLCFR